jgi:hypothetical protein
LLSSDYVITFGLTDSENQVIKNHLNDIKCELVTTDSYFDLINTNYFLSIINRKELNDNELKDLIEFYSEVDGNLSKRIILTKKTDTLTDVSNACVFLSFDDLEKDIDNILQKTYNKSKKAENNAASFSYAIVILSQIKKHTGIATSKLSKIINRTSPVVQRYIEALRIAGECIKYDKNSKGWKLQN